MSRSLIDKDQLKDGADLLLPPLVAPDGNVEFFGFTSNSYSQWLSLRLELLLRDLPGWQEAHPIATGSWARGEISPKSDIDLIFLNKDVLDKLLPAVHELGLKLRYRVPENLEDWTQGVEPFDILAFLKARAFTPHGAKQLIIQQNIIFRKRKALRKEMLTAIIKERKERNQRYDSISNYLEPNLKFGAGGLRDIQQSLQIMSLYQEKFIEHQYPKSVFNYFNHFLLTVRHKIHLEGGRDTILGPLQKPLAEWMHYKSSVEFMRQIQRGLASVSFYSDWVLEMATASVKRQDEVAAYSLKSFRDCVNHLEKDLSPLVQYRIRRTIGAWNFKPSKGVLTKRVGGLLEKAISPETSEPFLIAVYRSRLISQWVPEFKDLTGLCQLDQYHRYTADAHIIQVLREIKRVYQKPTTWGRFQGYLKGLTKQDWKILAWTGFFHDLGKGKKESHSLVGKKLVKRYMPLLDISSKVAKEVEWMVEHHLAVSQAAFKMNPQSPDTWKSLHQIGCTNKRLVRLALFTIADIKGTNPQAWNEWKESLLVDLIQVMVEGPGLKFISFLKQLPKRSKSVDSLIHQLDPTLFGKVPGEILAMDVKTLSKKGKGPVENDFLLVKHRKKEYFIRFHAPHNKPGLLRSYLRKIQIIGGKLLGAYVCTHEEFGVYDWFLFESSKSLGQMTKRLQSLGEGFFSEAPDASLEPWKVLDQESESIYVFRDIGNSSLLLQSVEYLNDHKKNILWLQTNDWGRRHEITFGVEL